MPFPPPTGRPVADDPTADGLVRSHGRAAPVSRRDLLKWFSAGAGAATVGGGAWWLSQSDSSTPASGRPGQGPSASMPRRSDESGSTTAPMAPAAPGARVLVVVEFGGGNDGLSMVVPTADGRYYDWRPNTAVAAEDVLALDDRFGLHPNLTATHRRGATLVQGVGSLQPDQSHFEMRARWWQGSPEAQGRFDTGVLGRLADVIGDADAPAVAVSVGDGAHPLMISAKASTLTVPGADAAGYLSGAPADDEMMQRYQRAYRKFSGVTGFGSDAEAQRSSVMQRSTAFADAVGTFEADDQLGYRDDRLGGGLRMAAQLFSQDLGLRIVHITMDGDFDTHEGHPWRYPELMSAFDQSVDAFFNDLAARGLSDRVLLMTMSEFGRTSAENSSQGVDHGFAAPMLVMGPVSAGRIGEDPTFDGEDAKAGVPATIGFDSYYATVFERWLGVPGSEVFGTDVELIDGLL